MPASRAPWVVTVDGRRLLLALTALAVVAGAAGAVRLAEQARRLRWGVKPGVTLEGIPMGGLLPHELTARLVQLQQRWRTPPQDARWDSRTGAVQPEQVGRELDVEQTRRRVLAARPFQRVQAAFLPILPAVSRRHFEPVYRGPAHRPWVAFSFNVDWGEEHLPSLLEELDRQKVKASFFLTGRWARRFPQLAELIARRGHEIGNHGMQHLHPKELSDRELERLIVEGERVLEQLTHQRPRLFAPPYGEVDRRIVAVAARLGYYTIMWTVDTLDWQRPPVQSIVDRVAEGLKPGAIVLMHPTEPTLQAIGRLVELARRQGLEPVTVGTLIFEHEQAAGPPQAPGSPEPPAALPGP
ncbi:MAG TPA: polysaccharide deacetylase family protein [Limnochordales bacterium]